jgi:hypothetical protein
MLRGFHGTLSVMPANGPAFRPPDDRLRPGIQYTLNSR